MPCWEDFAIQDDEYITSVLPDDAPRLAVEAGASFGWDRWANSSVSIDHFGASAPGATALAEFGFTPEHVAEAARALLLASART
jgi:transketolase